MNRRRGPATILLLLLLAPGCGPGGPRVAGKVTRAGTPIPRGLVQITPNLDKGNNGPTVSAPIVDGMFTTKDSTVPVTPGSNTVQVIVEGLPKKGQMPGEIPSEVRAFEIEIPSGGATELEFDVTKGHLVGVPAPK